MKIFVLEDNQERIKWFCDEFKDHSLTISVTADKGVYYIKNTLYDLIFLDHDLGGKVMLKSGEGTGYEVACEIAKSINKDVDVIVHSWNPVGADNICKVLSHARKVPFGMFKMRK